MSGRKSSLSWSSLDKLLEGPGKFCVVLIGSSGGTATYGHSGLAVLVSV